MDKGIIAANINAPFRFQSTAFSSRKILTKLEDEKFDRGLKEALEKLKCKVVLYLETVTLSIRDSFNALQFPRAKCSYLSINFLLDFLPNIP